MYGKINKTEIKRLKGRLVRVIKKASDPPNKIAIAHDKNDIISELSSGL